MPAILEFLTKVHNEIVHLVESDASPEDVLRKRVKFNEAWRKFVDAYESYLELLDSPAEALFWKRHKRSTTNS